MDTYRTLLALLGAPAAWVMQMALIEPIAAFACYPYKAPLSAPLWDNLPAILIAISLICLMGGLISGYVAWNSWQRVAKPGSNEYVRVVDGGQTKFLARLGIMSSFLFIIAIIYTGCAVLIVSPCSSWT